MFLSIKIGCAFLWDEFLHIKICAHPLIALNQVDAGIKSVNAGLKTMGQIFGDEFPGMFDGFRKNKKSQTTKAVADDNVTCI